MGQTPRHSWSECPRASLYEGLLTGHLGCPSVRLTRALGRRLQVSSLATRALGWRLQVSVRPTTSEGKPQAWGCQLQVSVRPTTSEGKPHAALFERSKGPRSARLKLRFSLPARARSRHGRERELLSVRQVPMSPSSSPDRPSTPIHGVVVKAREPSEVGDFVTSRQLSQQALRAAP